MKLKSKILLSILPMLTLFGCSAVGDNGENLTAEKRVMRAADTSEVIVSDTEEVTGDTVAPVITGPSTLVKPTGLTLTINDIKNMYSAKDAVDGDVDVTIKSDSYTGNADKKGTYEIAFTAKDATGNKATKVLDVEVLSGLPHAFYVDSESIYLNKSIGLSEEDVMTFLISVGELENGYSSYSVDSDTFTFDAADINDDGTYDITINARYYDGNEVDLEKKVVVYESLDPVEEKETTNWFIDALHWIYNTIIKNVANVFITIWNGICEMFNWNDAIADHLEDI